MSVFIRFEIVFFVISPLIASHLLIYMYIYLSIFDNNLAVVPVALHLDSVA